MKKIIQVSVLSLTVGILMAPSSANAWGFSNLFKNVKDAVGPVMSAGIDAIALAKVGIPSVTKAVKAFQSGDINSGFAHLSEHAGDAVKALGSGVKAGIALGKVGIEGAKVGMEIAKKVK